MKFAEIDEDKRKLNPNPKCDGKLSERYTPETSKRFLTKEILNTIEESRRATLEEKTGQ